MRALTDATAGMLAPIKFSEHDRLEIDVDKDLKNFIVRITTDSPVHFPSNAARSMWLQRVPERKQLEHPTNSWKLAATDYTAEIIKAIWPADRIIWMDPKAETLFDYLLLSTSAQDINAEVYAQFKVVMTDCLKEYKALAESGATEEELSALLAQHDKLKRAALPEDIGDLLIHPDVPLAPYQQCALWLGMHSEGYGYFMEQGTGKTPIVVSEICNLAARTSWQQPVRALIIPPKNVRVNWVHEFERFSTVPGKVEIVKGGEIARITSIIQNLVPEEGCQFLACVMSYESLVRSLDSMKTIMEEMDIDAWDLVALDESHFIKWPETQRAKAAMKLRDIARRRRVLTGTPVCNTPLDLYAQFEFMGEGWSGFRSWQNFRQFYGVFANVEGDARQKLVGVQNLPFMKERLARTSFIVSLEEALPDLPTRVFDTHEVEMTGEQAEAYEKLANDLMIEIEDELENSDNKTMTVNNILTKLLRLTQITAGYRVWDAVHDPQSLEEVRSKTIEWFAQDPKLDELVAILREKGPNDKTIVWSCFVPCIKRISERLEREGMNHVTYYGGTGDAEREEVVRRFNCDRDCKIFIGNPGAGGTGLNLLGYPPHGGDDYETNANHTIYYVQDWSYTKRSQSGARNHRKGTRVHVRETDLVVPDTLDEEIRIRVLKKKLVAMEIADIREILGAVLSGIQKGKP